MFEVSMEKSSYEFEFEMNEKEAFKYLFQRSLMNFATYISTFFVSMPVYYWQLGSKCDVTNKEHALLIAGITFVSVLVLNLLYIPLTGSKKGTYSIANKSLVKINEGGVYEETQVNYAYYKWKCVHSVQVYHGFLTIQLTSTTGIVLPDRAFENNEQKMKMAAWVRAFIDKHNKSHHSQP